MNIILMIIVLFLLAILVQASKRARQYKSILNRVAPSDPEYLSMIIAKKERKK